MTAAGPPPGDDWWDQLYETAEPHDQDDEPGPGPGVRDFVPRFLILERTTPAEEPTEPGERLDHKARVLGFNAGAAGVGWITGYIPTLRTLIATVERDTSWRGAMVIGVGLVGLAYVLDRYLSGLIGRALPDWAHALARFAVRVPLASATLALALYAPGYWTAP